jgi:hypothetical protein
MMQNTIEEIRHTPNTWATLSAYNEYIILTPFLPYRTMREVPGWNLSLEIVYDKWFYSVTPRKKPGQYFKIGQNPLTSMLYRVLEQMTYLLICETVVKIALQILTNLI